MVRDAPLRKDQWEKEAGFKRWQQSLEDFLYKMFIKVKVDLSGCKPSSIKKNTI